MGTGDFNLVGLCLVPLTAVLVRYRVAYSPRLILSEDAPVASGSSSEDDSERPATTFWQTIKRTYTILGIKGFTNGLVPTIWFGLVLPIPFARYALPPKLYASPSPGVLGLDLVSALVYTIFYHIFYVVIVYRCITTTSELDSWRPQEALRTVFTVHERKQPWAIHRTPGLLPAMFLNVCINILVLRTVSMNFIFPTSLPTDVTLTEELIRTGLNLLMALLATVVLAPLEVIITRLAIQKNYGHTLPQIDTGASIPDVEKNSVTVLPVGLVIQLPREEEPYLGLVDCATRISMEEGWGALYRGWILTFTGALFV